jgi:hypothetical protein
MRTTSLAPSFFSTISWDMRVICRAMDAASSIDVCFAIIISPCNKKPPGSIMFHIIAKLLNGGPFAALLALTGAF